MVWYFILFAALPLPLIGPGLGLAGALAAGGGRRGQAPGLLLALALLLPTFLLAQALLSVAGWAQQPLAEAGPTPPYAPWPAELLLAPVCYLYFRVLGSARLKAPGAWRALLPGLGQVGLFAGVAVLELGCRPGPAGGPAALPAPAAALLRPLVAPLAVACYVLLVAYGLRTLTDYQRYCRVRAAAQPGAPAAPGRGSQPCWYCCCWASGWG